MILISIIIVAAIIVGIVVLKNWNHKENLRMLEDFPLDPIVQRKYAPLVGEKYPPENTTID